MEKNNKKPSNRTVSEAYYKTAQRDRKRLRELKKIFQKANRILRQIE